MKNKIPSMSCVSEAFQSKILDDGKHKCLLKCSKKHSDSKVPDHRGAFKLCMDQCLKDTQ